MAKQKKALPTTPVQSQASQLLKLPPELRNTVYNYVAQGESTSTIHLGTGKEPQHRVHDPALARVCRQLRQEYKSIFVTEAPRFATRLVAHLVNFDASGLVPAIAAISRPSSSVTRAYTLHIELNNFFDVHALFCLAFGRPTEDPTTKRQLKYDLIISYNPKSFDTDYCDKCLGRNAGTSDWEKFREAFEAAHLRYAAPKKAKKRKKPQTQKKASREDGGCKGMRLK
ncbi:hypothetical protein LTR36_010356 [Oleoguttula mirabilis]|uniref:Uncharacterized protein n=1 Tax=Oleoguttula mirabilis TaxID=1507867 RepID=A0AAV9J4A0_9PEZI|nr:hypothetical protein LTR36_010356 [Oleoguttula mirabilis]